MRPPPPPPSSLTGGDPSHYTSLRWLQLTLLVVRLSVCTSITIAWERYTCSLGDQEECPCMCSVTKCTNCDFCLKPVYTETIFWWNRISLVRFGRPSTRIRRFRCPQTHFSETRSQGGLKKNDPIRFRVRIRVDAWKRKRWSHHPPTSSAMSFALRCCIVFFVFNLYRYR